MYRSDPGFTLACRMVVALAFVPLHRLEKGINVLVEDYLPQEAQFYLTVGRQLYR